MALWEALFPIQSPLKNAGDAERNAEHLPITTRKGRVVYNRKPHQFTRSDAARVLGNVFGATGKKDSLSFWITILEETTIWMLDKVIEYISQSKQPDEIASRIYYIARDMLARVFDRLAEDLKKKADPIITGNTR